MNLHRMLAQRAEEEVLALERAHDRPAPRALEGRGRADEQRVRQDHEVERRQALEVAEELAEGAEEFKLGTLEEVVHERE